MTDDDRKNVGFDWADIKSRLARTADALRTTTQRTPEQEAQILARRAAKLAQVHESPPDAKEFIELLHFRINAESFAMETKYVQEVLRPGMITPVPGVPRCVEGVTNLRGEVLAVMDLRMFFEIAGQADDKHRRIVVIGPQHAEFGLLVDRVEEVTCQRIATIRSVPPSVPAGGRRLLQGVLSDGTLIFDGEFVLDDARLHIDQDD